MTDSIDTAKEAIESTEHGREPDAGARYVAVLVAALAVALALTEMGSKTEQNEYLTQHIQAADDWNFYQAKNIRSDLYTLQADALDSLPVASDPAVRKRIDEWRAQSRRLDDDEKTQGRKQLIAKAHASEEARDHAHHRFHLFEIASGALEISIVLASVSVVTRVRTLALAAATLGAVAALFSLAEWFDMF
jgi:hypothetical protein